MALLGDTSLLASIKWQEQPVALKDFAAKHQVPNIVKVTKGQYRAIGVSKSVHSELYLYTVSTGKKVLTESVKIKDGKATCSQQKYGIPLTYQGWFEVLSENGQAVKPLFTIPDLLVSVRSSKNPNPTYLVRESLKGFTASGDAELNTNSEVTVGEIIIVGAEVWKNQALPKHGIVSKKFVPVTAQGSKETIFVPVDGKCKLSPIAGLQNISGVHNVQALLDKFRLPIMVRLVHGLIPTKLEKRFTAIFRLLRVYGDETMFFCPLKKDSKMVPISTREPLKIVPTENYDEVKDSPEISVIHQRAEHMHSSFMNSIHVLFSLPEPAVRPPGSAIGLGNSPKGPKVEEDILFEEVEDIYMHVRQGGEPPPPRPRPAQVQQPQPQPQQLPPAPKKEGKTSSILGAFASKFSRKSTKNTSNVVAASPKSPVTPTSPMTPVNDHHSPPPLPAKTQKQKDFDYWEEPIYEPLEKIQNMKREKEKETVIQMSSSSPQLKSGNSIEPIDNPLATMANSDGDIKTLREVYKHTTGHGSDNSANSTKDKNHRSSKKSDSPVHIPHPDYDIDAEPVAPPVPPKNFDMVELEAKLKAASENKSKHGKQILGSPQGHMKSPRSHAMPVATKPSSPNNASSKQVYVKANASNIPSHKLTAAPLPPKTTTSPLSPISNASPETKPSAGTPTYAQVRQVKRTTSPLRTDSVKPYLIKNVTPSSRKAKGTTVHIDGSDAARISTPLPSHAPLSTAKPHGSASKMSYVQSQPSTSHPPFVAVARVGDSFEQENPLYNNGAVAHRVSVDQHRRKLQSMYL